MRFGIDFGTTRTVVAAADRGNYPVVSFQLDSGDVQPWYPSLIATRGEQCFFGLDAQMQPQQSGWFFLRSLKRLLAEAGPETMIQVGHVELGVLDWVTRYLTQLRVDLCARSNIDVSAREPLEALIAVPANANSNQRFVTLEGFRRAGFRVLGLINEPSAAGIEYAHRDAAKGKTGRKEYLVIYDLGGGTFDASVISMKDRYHEVLTAEGIGRLGGDDFDELLLELTLQQAPHLGELSPTVHHHLLEICREQKEALHPNTRKMVIDLGRAIPGAREVMVTTEAFYERCRPLVERTIETMELAMSNSLRGEALEWAAVAGIYLVGGSSDLPLVSRLLRERYGRRVRRSPYPYAATAIGLAIAADAAAGYKLQERFTRYFGVWREADGGRRIVFDPIFFKDTPLPAAGEPPLIYTRAYQPVHNIGHFRYLECSQVNDDHQPCGEVTPWDEIFFPFDPALQAETSLHQVPVTRSESDAMPLIQERYVCHSHGVIEVTIANHTAGFQRTYRLRELAERRRGKQKQVSQGSSK